MLQQLPRTEPFARGFKWLAAWVLVLIGGINVQAFAQGDGKEGRNRKGAAGEGASMPFRPADGSTVGSLRTLSTWLPEFSIPIATFISVLSTLVASQGYRPQMPRV